VAAPPGPAGPSGAGGSPYVTTPRGPTSHGELEIDWDHPVVPRAAERDGERSAAVAAKRALPAAEALALVAGDDPRPLLVLRECLTCTGTDDALLTRRADNEKTMLLSRWFHCVKLPPDVLADDHPFQNLFPGDDPSHLFVSARDGAGRHDLGGAQSRTELWGAMQRVLAASYVKEPDKALKELYGILDDYDALDGEIAELQRRIDLEVEDDGPGSPKAKTLKKRLTELFAERSDLRAEALRVSALELRQPRTPDGEEPAEAG
jgi:hypothetical protein